MNLRLFIAIEIPEQIKREIGELIDVLKKHDTDIKWIMPDNIHLTLKFLGATSDSLVLKIRESLTTAVSSCEPFSITIQSAGAFPNDKYPRVLWTGIIDSHLLKDLRDRIENSLSMIGFQRDDKEFHPHLTIGRVRSQKGMLSFMEEFRLFRDRHFGGFLADQVKLMKSELRPTGPLYTCLHMIPLSRKDVVCSN
jgi:RNA 2',3'-cyclic 3'-phosphodiesterase